MSGYQQTTRKGVTVLSSEPLSDEELIALDAWNADASRRIAAMSAAMVRAARETNGPAKHLHDLLDDVSESSGVARASGNT